MSIIDRPVRRVVPAQLNYLAIYSPALGLREDNKHDQIVYFYSRQKRERQRRRGKDDSLGDPTDENEKQEQSRQVGLAQGMLSFARGFASDTPLEYVETEKHRIVLTELEKGWWILASIDLTRLPNPRQTSPASSRYEYSARETSPPELLIQQLIRAHRTFLLHKRHSLSDLYLHLSRGRFCDTLERYWTPFASSWDVLLHGNPAVDAYAGIKLAAGGELGIGVGEEDWGSGEREVLEGLVRNTEGLHDIAVSRFGDGNSKDTQEDATPSSTSWMGRKSPASPADGLIFSGTGKLSRPALRDLSHWMEDVYSYGSSAYGIQSGLHAARKKPRKERSPAMTYENKANADDVDEFKEHKSNKSLQSVIGSTSEHSPQPEDKVINPRHLDPPDIPPPIVRATSAAEKSLQNATQSTNQPIPRQAPSSDTGNYSVATNTLGNPDAWKKVLTLGYGSAWGISRPTALSIASHGAQNQRGEPSSGGRPASKTQASAKFTATSADDAPHESHLHEQKNLQSLLQDVDNGQGHFLIGLIGDLDVDDAMTNSLERADGDQDEDSSWSGRLSLRTLYVTMNESHRDSSRSKSPTRSSASSTSAVDARNPLVQNLRSARVRVVVYAHRPFLYTLLFDPECSLLTYPSFFHDLHHHLTPLNAPLQRSTAPATIAANLAASLPQPQPSLTGPGNPIHTFVYSPSNGTIRSSIPNIPAPGTAAAEGIVSATAAVLGEAQAWTRVEALSVHSRILETLSETRAGSDNSAHNVRRNQQERTLKTGKGWWIVWLRVSTTSAESGDFTPTRGSSIHSSQMADGHLQEATRRPDKDYKEAFLIRRSADSSSAGGRKTAYRALSPSGASVGWMQGIGSSAMAPFSRWSGGAGQSGSVSGTVQPGEGPLAGTGESGSNGGIGVDAKRYVEGLLSLNR